MISRRKFAGNRDFNTFLTSTLWFLSAFCNFLSECMQIMRFVQFVIIENGNFMWFLCYFNKMPFLRLIACKNMQEMQENWENRETAIVIFYWKDLIAYY